MAAYVDNSQSILRALEHDTVRYGQIALAYYLRPYWCVWVPILAIIVGIRLQSLFRRR